MAEQDGNEAMMQAKQNPSIIRPEETDGQNYFLSLIDAGIRCGLIETQDREILLSGCRSILVRKLGFRLHEGSRGNLDSETTLALLDSVYYTIGVELKSFGSPEAGLTAIRSRPIEDLYMAGQVKIRSKLRTAHLLQRHLKKTLFRTQNRPYTDTVKTKLDGFFRLYRPASFAQQLHVTVEYQTFPPVSELSGIEFIEAFLRRLVLENSFCCLFDPAAVDAMLERENPDFRNVMINIYRSVLRAALGCVLTGRPVEALEYDPAAAEALLDGKEPDARREQLLRALKSVTVKYGCHPDLCDYLAEGTALL